jgi:hypothetical protein
MSTSLIGALGAIALLLSVNCTPAVAQWVVSLEIGAERFWGGSIETTPEQRSFRPYRPTTLGIGLERKADDLGIALRFRYAEAPLALEGEEAALAVKGIFDVYSIAPELSYRLVTVGHDVPITLHAGPLVEVWSIVDEGSKTHVGAHGEVSLTVPLGSGLAGTFLAGGAVMPSPFSPEQLIENYEPRTLWRRGVAARLEYRL